MQFENFTNQYALSKTLKFELIPQGKTLAHIEAKGLLSEDEHRAESYKIVKNIIDRYHKRFIEESLSELTIADLDTYFNLYNIQNKTADEQKAVIAIQDAMRKSIAKHIEKHPKYKILDKKELIQNELFPYCENDEEKGMVLEFQKFTTYFAGFNDNRKNMYSSEEKTTAIAYRIVNQNLPKYIDNMKVFETLATPLATNINTMTTEMQNILGNNAISDFFTLDFFNQTLTQKGIDRYNTVLGGFTDPNNHKKKIKGLNEYINLYNQSSPETGKIGKLTPLYKQILSDKESVSFLPETLQNGQAVLDAIRNYYENNLIDIVNEYGTTGKTLKEVMQKLANGGYDLSRIFIRNDASITEISQKMLGNWGILNQALNAHYDQTYTGKYSKKPEKYEAERKKHFKSIDSFSIEFLNLALTYLDDQTKSSKRVEKFFGGLGGDKNLITAINESYEELEKLMLNPYPADKELSQDTRNVEKIKTFLDNVKALQWFIKPLLGKGTEPNKDPLFYGDLMPLWNELDQITQLYNSIRNYMTKKPYSTEKIKLNFQNSTLLAGWDANKERDNTGLLFIKDGMYYLGIMDYKHNKSFIDIPTTSGDVYQKVKYKQLSGPEKMLPKVFFSKSRIDEFAPSDDVLAIYQNKTFLKGDNFNLADCHTMIDFYKQSIAAHPEWCSFNHQFAETSTYQNIGEFYNDVKTQGYKITYQDVPVDYMDELIDEGKLYLFQIYNKDFSPYSKGTPNLHTLYWKMLFDEQNLNNVVYKLNGEAEVFFRKASLGVKVKPTHPKGEAIANKNPLNPKTESVFAYDLIKNKRFTMDKFLFHVPIKINFKANPMTNLNMSVRSYLKEKPETNIIGIHRGERNLLYVVVINSLGEILEQYSLNEIINESNGVVHKTNYHDLLDRKEAERDTARKNWQTIENIKELKEGYLSQVVHKIANLMLKYQAIVVIEDLNMTFKQDRQKVEKQVYQKFEHMLINKLQYLVDKKAPIDQPGGLLKALQLAKNEVRGSNSYEKQNGFLFYVPSWNTSSIDPTTGFVNLFNGSDLRYESINKSKAFINLFDEISYNKTAKYFEFHTNYNNFTNKGQGTKTDWIICTHGNRHQAFRNADKNSQWDWKEINITQSLKQLFDENGIDYQSKTLKEDLLQMNSKSFFMAFLDIIRLTLQMRNKTASGDYLISPVCNDTGDFFDSRNMKAGMPENEDANGAFNIARKGAWIVDAIKTTDADKLNKVKMAMANKEWLEYAQAHLI